MKFKFRSITILLLILALAFPTYANMTYKRTYYNKDVKLINQYDTGEYGYVSCIPTAIKMLLDYQDIKSESVSSMFNSMNGSKTGIDVMNAISYINSTPNISAPICGIDGKDVLKTYIDGNLSYILIINPHKIKEQTKQPNKDIIPVLLKPIGKDYHTTGDSIHSVAVVGYIEIGDKLYLEILDPVSNQISYYDADNVIESLEINYLIIIKRFRTVYDKSTE